MLDRKIRYCSLPEAIREHFLWGARSIVIAGTHGKTTTTALTGWVLTHGGARPERARRRHRAQLRRARLELPARAGARLRHRRRRVRQRVLRQDGEVPEVPARHRRRQQHRVRSRRHLRRPRRGDAGVPPARQPRAAPRAAAARRRQPGRAGAAGAAPCRASQTFGTARRRRLAGARPRAAGHGRRGSASARRGCRSARSRCRCSARTTCGTRWRPSPSPPRSGIGAERIAEGLRDVRRRQAAARGRRARPTASRSTTTSPTIRRPSPKRWPGCARRIPAARIWAVFEPRSASSCRRVFQDDFARAFARRRRSAARAGLSLDAAGGRAAVGAAARRDLTRARPVGAGGRSIDDIVAHDRPASTAPGDLVVVMSNGGFGGIHQKLLQALGASCSERRRSRSFAAGDSAALAGRVRGPDRSRRQRARRRAGRGAAGRSAIAGVRDVVPTFRSVAVYFDPLRTDVRRARGAGSRREARRPRRRATATRRRS